MTDPTVPGWTAQMDDPPPVTPMGRASAPTAVVVGTTAVQLLAARAGRGSLLVQNADASNEVFLGFGADPTTDNGIRLKPGESFGDDRYTGSVRAIATADTTVRVVEFY